MMNLWTQHLEIKKNRNLNDRLTKLNLNNNLGEIRYLEVPDIID